MTRILYTLLALLFLLLFWLFRPDGGVSYSEISVPEKLPSLSFDIHEVVQHVQKSEQRAGPLKPDNHARIIWNDTHKEEKAPCSIVYIHGFTASFGEGAPLHAKTADALGCHLYVPRLHAHGLVTEQPLMDMHPDSLLADVAHALAIGDLLGDKVVVVGTSMGGMLSLHLASSYPESVDYLVLLAPLVEFAQRESFLFDKSWGQRLMKLLLGGSYVESDPQSDDHGRYWYQSFRIESLHVLKTLKVNLLQDEIYGNITQPTFAGYYYRDEEHQDELVSVKAIESIESKLATLPEKRQFIAFPEVEDHVIGSSYRTDAHQQVTDSVITFLKRHMQEP